MTAIESAKLNGKEGNWREMVFFFFLKLFVRFILEGHQMPQLLTNQLTYRTIFL